MVVENNMSKEKGELQKKSNLFLQDLNFEIVEKNFYAKNLEIDIIAKKILFITSASKISSRL